MKNTLLKFILLFVLLASRGYSQTIYTWTNLVGGDATGGWDNPLNWSPNGLPKTGDTANFSTLDITANSTVFLDGNQTNANLVFGDAVASSDWTIDASGILTLESAFGSPIITVTNRTATIQATIDGTNGFTKLGTGALILSGQNIYSGVTTQSVGTLTIGIGGGGSPGAPSSGAFGVSTVSLEGGTLNVAVGGGLVYNNIVVPTGKTVAMGTTVSGVQLALAGNISGGGTINESGNQTAGTHLSGDNSGFTGTFNSTGNGSHRVRFDSATSGSAAAVWLLDNSNTDGEGLAFGDGVISFGALSGNGQIRNDNGGTGLGLSVVRVGDLNTSTTFTGNFANVNTLSLLKVGTGKLILTGANQYRGSTTISNGVLQLGNGGNSGTINNDAFASATVDTTVYNYSKLVFSYNRSDTFAFNPLRHTGTGSFAFTNIGTGIMTVRGTNSYSGDTTIAAGTIRLLSPFAIPGGPGVGNLVLNGTLDLNSNSIVINGLSGNGAVDNLNINGGVQTLTIGSNDVSSVFSGAIKNSAAPTNGSGLALVKVGSGAITISGANTYNGNTTINGGELDINTSKTAGGAITVNTGTTLGILVNSATSIPTTALNLSAASVLSFSGLNSATVAPFNATNLAPNGTVTINVAGSFAAGNQYPLIKFTTYGGTGGFVLNSIPLGTTATLVTNGNTIALNVTGAAPLIWKGNLSTNWDIATTANWTLSSIASPYVDGQTVRFDDTASAGLVNLSAVVSPGGVLVTNNSLNYFFGSISGNGITGSGGLTKLGSGTLNLSGLANTYSGATIIGGGTVVINADNNLGAATPGNITLDGGTLSAGNTLTLIANRTLAIGPSTGSGGGAIDVSSGQTLTFGGIVANNNSGTGSLTKTGAGTLVLNGANTYSGNTIVAGGKLSLTAAQQGRGALSVNDGATLSVSRSGANTFAVSSLTLGSSGATTLQLGNLDNSNAVVTVTNLTTSGTVTVSVLTGVPAIGEVPLIKYSSLGGSGFGAFTLAPLPAGVTAVLTNDTVNKIVGLLVTDVAALTWTGKNGSTWDIGVTTNWQYLGADVAFQAGGAVVLDDTGLTNFINLNTTASVFNLLVNNNATNYTLAGNGSLSGPMMLTKTGTNTFTMANLGSDAYTGGTVVQEGTLDVRNNTSLGSGAITLAGGALENNSASGVTLPNNVVVQTGTTNMILTTGTTDGQINLAGNFTGDGTVIANNSSTGLGGIFLSGDNSGFTGTLITSNNASLRFNFNSASSGSANANWVLTSVGTDNQRIAFGNGTISFGSLSGNGNCRQDVPNTLSILRIGDLNTNSSWSGTLNQGAASQRIGILKVGTSAWTVTASQPYTGPTTISNGVLALAMDPVTFVDGAIPGTTNIYIAAGAALDVSGRSDGNISLGISQVLSGSGTVLGNLDTFAGGTIAPGDGISGNIGTLTVTNNLSLGGTTWMKLNRTGNPNSDRLVSPIAINYGGTLVITNVGATLQPGDTFTLFSSATFNGSSFGAVMVPNYFNFDTSNLNVDGTIKFIGYSIPAISSVDFSTLSSGSITLNATNGLPGGPVVVLTTTNLTLPVSAWTPVVTNAFDGGGNFTQSITIDPALPRQFYLLQVR